MRTISIGELARAVHINLETIRFYEREGLMIPPPRTPSGHRAYSRGDMRRLRFIRRAQSFGFTLSEIKALLALRVDPDQSCAEVMHQVDDKLREVKARIAHLHAIEKTLHRMRTSCDGRCAMSECPILESMDAGVPS